MVLRPSVLCPIDFSEASRGALRYAAAVAEHFQATLTVLTVNDPLLADAAIALRGTDWLGGQAEQDLETFVKDTFGERRHSFAELQLAVATGKPAPLIIRTALEHQSDLIVMSSHGLTGPAKLIFGSTTDRVLRETSLPVLVTPAVDPGPENLEDVKAIVRTILVPVDLTTATPLQVRIARGLAEALGSTILLAHVFEPPLPRPSHRSVVGPLQQAQRQEAERALTELMATLPAAVHPELVLAEGRPPEEIARIARERKAGALVMGLHAGNVGGPRMGSVTYQVLCHCTSLVLALPPAVDKIASRRLALATAAGSV